MIARRGFCCCLTASDCVWYLSFNFRIQIGKEKAHQSKMLTVFIMRGIACLHRRPRIFGHLIYKKLMIALFSVNILSVLCSELYSRSSQCKISPDVLCKPCVNCIVLWSVKFYMKMLIVTTSFFLGYLWVSNDVLNEIYCTAYRCLIKYKWWKQTPCWFKFGFISSGFVYLVSLHISMATDWYSETLL